MRWGGELFNYVAEHRNDKLLMEAPAGVAAREMLFEHFKCIDLQATEIRKQTRYLE